MPRPTTMTILVLAFVLGGCASPVATDGQAVRASSATTSPRAAMNPDPAPRESQPQEAGEGGGRAQQDDPPRHIEYRYFQLKDLEVAEVKFEDTKFRMWVMDTQPKRSEGMMYVQDGDFKEDQGMIFVFSRPQQLGFWMRNTLVPLDIAYCDAKGRVLNTYTMKALDETSDYSSKGNAMFAIELKAGTIKKLKIDAGDRFEIPETVRAKD